MSTEAELEQQKKKPAFSVTTRRHLVGKELVVNTKRRLGRLEKEVASTGRATLIGTRSGQIQNVSHGPQYHQAGALAGATPLNVLRTLQKEMIATGNRHGLE